MGAPVVVVVVAVGVRRRRRRGWGRTARTLAGLGLAVATAWSGCHPGGASSPPQAPQVVVSEVGCVEIPVASLARSEPFYREVLGFAADAAGPLDEAGGRRARLQVGAECVELLEPAGGARRPVPADSRSNDLWFQHLAIVVSDLDAAYARLEARGVPRVSEAPQTLPAWNQQAGGIRAYYFRDPDGHTLELIWFPAGKGAARWHAASPLVLGIDHTAIASSDTARSLALYAGRLGLKRVGGSENFGPEQERLNHVPGAHLRITTLRAPAGPGIELLEYVQPRDGRPLPTGERAGDLTHWRTRLHAAAVARPVELRDPDGHALLLAPLPLATAGAGASAR